MRHIVYQTNIAAEWRLSGQHSDWGWHALGQCQMLPGRLQQTLDFERHLRDRMTHDVTVQIAALLEGRHVNHLAQYFLKHLIAFGQKVAVNICADCRVVCLIAVEARVAAGTVQCVSLIIGVHRRIGV